MTLLEFDLADGVVDRTQHRQHHPAEERAEDDGHGGLDHHLHFADGILYVAVVEVGHVEQRIVELAGGLAPAPHAYPEAGTSPRPGTRWKRSCLRRSAARRAPGLP